MCSFCLIRLGMIWLLQSTRSRHAISSVCNVVVSKLGACDRSSLERQGAGPEWLKQNCWQGYSCFTQACGELEMVEARDSFLASLCECTLQAPELSKGDVSSPTAEPVGMLLGQNPLAHLTA